MAEDPRTTLTDGTQVYPEHRDILKDGPRAGHQNLSTTMGYSRGSADAIARVLGTKKKEGEE